MGFDDWNPVIAERRAEPQSKKKPRGRSVLFRGKRVKMTIKVTERAGALIQLTQATLRPRYGLRATEGAAVEYLVRKATRTRMTLT